MEQSLLRGLLQDLEAQQVPVPDAALPELHPGFFIPRLTDKPQNPIIDTISLMQRTHEPVAVSSLLPVEVEALVEDTWAVAETNQKAQNNIWNQVAHERSAGMHRLMSWDTLRTSFSSQTISSTLLTQQSARVFASVRHYVRPPVHDPSNLLIYVTGNDLLQSLHLTLTGLSSSIYIWDAESEQFVLRAVPRGTKGTLVLIGTDEVISGSIVQRFLVIGTLMRRLENLVQSYNTRHMRIDQVSHSFIHALSSVTDYLRKRIAESASTDVDLGEGLNVTAVWLRYAATEEVLEALAALSNRAMHVSPSTYPPLPTAAVELLSKIYCQLDDAFENHSPHSVTAILAYILTVVSKGYFRQVSESVGYKMPVAHSADVAVHDDLGIHDEEPPDDQDDTFYEEQASEESYPIFLQTSLADALPRAKRSLRLLREAQPDHPLLRARHNQNDTPDVDWFWTEADVAAAWTGHRGSLEVISPPAQHAERSAQRDPPVQVREYKEELKDLALFDLVPGQHLGLLAPPALQPNVTGLDNLELFMSAFPVSLPSLTPTLSHLTTLVLTPLTRHMEALSEALVSLVLSPTSLNLPLHLSILRSYLLLTSYAFKPRLAAALFSDSDEPPNLPSGASAVNRRNAESSVSSATSHRAVGLSPVLTAANIWPPSVPELSFHLRTVINDSLQNSFGHLLEQVESSPRLNSIVREAEYRLGFAIRDLPTGTGKEKWLDPLSIEAFDFLYLDYKPPRPLHVVITPDVLSKYHRIFAFNLRLMRVSSAMATTYRITRRSSMPLFPTLSQTNKLFLHVRFVANAFVAALSSYIYDRAIGLRFDDFLTKLNTPEDGIAQNKATHFSDVFALTEYHSSVLDDILSACLLRSGQKAVGDVLRGCLELVLELAVLAGDRCRGRMEEYQAAPLVEDLWERLRKKVLTLIRVLRALVERGSGTSQEAVADVEAQLANLSRLDGVTGSLHDLVTRLDVAEWWIRR